ncbi:ECF-type sigma factor [Marivirga sp.]|uniref:ECF-type sigma factor n=1 Tax=Marivirga sp. TaxID=2018662 RepID=UPI003DA74ADD
MINQGEITQLLVQVNRGDMNAYNKIFPVIYSELRHIAHRIRFQYFGIETLNTTAIVHEAYLKIINSEANWESRAHFYGVAGKAMRHILLNAARRKNAIKRGRDAQHICFEEWEEKINLSDDCSEELLKLDEVLNDLERKDSKQVKIVECRFFANMTIEETATVLNVSPSTVKRNWQVIKAWIYSQIQAKKTA